MAINKVEYGDRTLIDLTGDTVTADKLYSGYTAHNAAGEQITGTLIPSATTIPIDPSPVPTADGSMWVTTT